MPTELKQRRGLSEAGAAMIVIAVAAIVTLLAFSLIEAVDNPPDAATSQSFYAFRVSPWPGLQ
jgi:hypothetical protein